MSLSVIRDMNEFGVCVLDNFIGEERGKKVLEEVHNMYNAGYFKVNFRKLIYDSKLTMSMFYS